MLVAAVVVSGAPYAVPVTASADPGPPPGIPAPPPSRTVDDPVPGTDDGSDQTSAWERAVDEADGPHLDQVMEPRPLAAIIGTVWFALVLRSRWRARRASRSSA